MGGGVTNSPTDPVRLEEPFFVWRSRDLSVDFRRWAPTKFSYLFCIFSLRFFSSTAAPSEKKGKRELQDRSKKGQFRVCGIPLVGGHKLTPPLPKRIRTHHTFASGGRREGKEGKREKRRGGGRPRFSHQHIGTAAASIIASAIILFHSSASAVLLLLLLLLLLPPPPPTSPPPPPSVLCYAIRRAFPPSPPFFALWYRIRQLDISAIRQSMP